MISTNHQPAPAHSIARRPSSGGSRVGLLTTILLMLGAVNPMKYREPLVLDQEALEQIFGQDGCIEGHFSMEMMPTVPVVLQPMQDNHITSSDLDGKVNHQMTIEDGIISSTSDPSIIAGKEKTPMCLVNELARYNKIEHQYRLTSEEGPPHKKKFTVTLKLGSEEYTAEGPSIKKAQHSAAGLALKSTTYKRPPPKSSRNPRQGKGNITPTVELNALAMKRGEPTTYTLVEMPQYSYPPNPYTYHHRSLYTQRYYGGKAAFKVKVIVGEREFRGEGVSAQAARHDAAAKALQTLRNLPVDTNVTHQSSYDGSVEADSGSDLKSPISLVHEIALKRNMQVVFEVISEKGPPHMRTFVTRCMVGDKFSTTGEGNGKKVSKKRAAEKMLDELRTLPPTTSVTVGGNSLTRTRRKANPSKKKSRNLIKDTVQVLNTPETKYEDNEEINPISRLIQIQQAKKEKEPVYTLRDERGLPRRREFVMEVTVGDYSYIGTGPNKKMAKRNAAEGLLQAMGYSSPTVNRQGQPHQQPHTNKVRFADDKSGSGGSNMGGVSGRQLVPGLILMNDKSSNGNTHSQPRNPGPNMKISSAIAKDYLSEEGGRLKGSSVRPSDQLRYLAQILNFQIQFSDFPKSNHSEYLSLVTLGTDPPQVCHGAGGSTELSQDQAALNALRSLSEMGLDSIAPGKKEQQQLPSTPTADGIYLPLANSVSKDDSYVNGK